MKSDIYSLGALLKIILGDEDLPILSMCLQDDPDKRPCCGEILDALLPSCPTPSYSDYKFMGDELGDVDRFNICYYWTDFDPENEIEELALGRRLLYQESFEHAIEIFSHLEDTAAKVLLGIMRFHGYGCSRDIQAACQLFEGCDLEDLESDKLHLCSLIEYYTALVKLECGSHGKESGMKDLMQLAGRGHSLAQFRLAVLHSRTVMHSGSEGTHKRMHQRFLFDAAKAGYSHAQALIALCFVYVTHKKELSEKDHNYLVKSVEGGSVLGKVLLDFMDDTINQVEALQSKNLGLLELLAHLYRFTLAEEPAEWWFREAAKEGSLDSCVMFGILYKGTGDLSTAKEWLLKAQQLDKGTRDYGNHHWCVDHSISKMITWVYALADIYFKEGNYEEVVRIIQNSDDTGHTAVLDFAHAYSDYKYHPILQSFMQERRASMSLDNLLMVGIWHQQKGTGYASEWLEEGARLGDGRAINALGCMKLKQGAISEAIQLFQKSATLGDVDGLLNCGIMKIEQENDLESAESYFEQAVSKRHPIAMAELARLLPEGNSRAIQLLEEAVVLGEEDYLFALSTRYESEEKVYYCLERGLRNIEYGVMVELGIGYEDMETSYLVARSAETKSPLALYHMGIYLMREGKDEEVTKYLEEAARKGHRQSRLLLIAMDEEDSRGSDKSSKWRSLDREQGYSGRLADEYNHESGGYLAKNR